MNIIKNYLKKHFTKEAIIREIKDFLSYDNPIWEYVARKLIALVTITAIVIVMAEHSKIEFIWQVVVVLFAMAFLFRWAYHPLFENRKKMKKHRAAIFGVLLGG